jgi:para-aminobenzoate synthetase / 4-amino-4-deoxychorismate lyase
MSGQPPGLVVVQDGRRWRRYLRPVEVLAARASTEVARLVRSVEAAVEGRGLHAAGFLAYEAAAAYGLAVREPRSDGPPLAWFGLYAQVEEMPGPPAPPAEPPAFGPWQAALDASAHAEALGRIQERITAGDTDQANFTFPLRASFQGDPWPTFAGLVRAHRASLAAYLDLGRHVIASLSPELFFRREGDRLLARPMKGTARRGPTPGEDEARAARLGTSAKDRAENLMIVDMLRNDLGRVAEVGSVRVASRFDVVRYPTLLQMTSTVEARSRVPFAELLAALFPGASVTGAPKVGTMRVIADLEGGPRGVYTGAIGTLDPGGDACFSVAIRTLVIDRDRGEAEYGVGSGIVADSVAADAYAECLLEARILEEKPFRLLETLRWTPEEGYFLLEAHLERLVGSARHLGGEAEEAALRAALDRFALTLARPSRVRLLVDLDGNPMLEAAPLPEALGRPLRIGLAPGPIDTDSPWLYHKTTRREAYDAALAARPDCDEVLLWNARGEVTEGTRSNLVVEMPEGRVTPPVSSGLLPGTMRRSLLASGEVRERVVRIEDLAGRRLTLVNSVRGLEDAVLADTPATTGA